MRGWESIVRGESDFSRHPWPRARREHTLAHDDLEGKLHTRGGRRLRRLIRHVARGRVQQGRQGRARSHGAQRRPDRPRDRASEHCNGGQVSGSTMGIVRFTEDGRERAKNQPKAGLPAARRFRESHDVNRTQISFLKRRAPCLARGRPRGSLGGCGAHPHRDVSLVRGTHVGCSSMHEPDTTE